MDKKVIITGGFVYRKGEFLVPATAWNKRLLKEKVIKIDGVTLITDKQLDKFIKKYKNHTKKAVLLT